MSNLYPNIEPYEIHSISVGSNHNLYVEECGNRNGNSVIFLHGGPGMGCIPDHRRFFDPKKYRVVLFDQRGCGKSTPHASLEDNNSQALIEDTECIRQKLDLGKIILFGGSWGSTLSLLYAIHYPENVNEMVLRGIFLCRREEIDWFYRGKGTAYMFPDHHADYMSVFDSTVDDEVAGYYELLTSNDSKIRQQAAKCWSLWEAKTATLLPSEHTVDLIGQDSISLSMARIECHFFINNIFFPENFILDHCSKIKHIKTHIVHGRYDAICPMKNAFELNSALNNSELHIIDDAGHAASEAGIAERLIEIMDKIR